METVSAQTMAVDAEVLFTCDKSMTEEEGIEENEEEEENFDCCQLAANAEASSDVVESFELLHQSIPWLQRARVSSDSYKGQLKILQAAIDYIIDLEEQLAEHLSEDLYRVAIRESKAALERTLANTAAAAAAAAAASGRRQPFAEVNTDTAADNFDEDDDEDDAASAAASTATGVDYWQQQQHPRTIPMPGMFLSSRNLRSANSEEELHRPS